MARAPLTKREYVVKVLDLIEAFGGGRKAINELADKWDVHEATVYRWSSYLYATKPIPPNKDKLLRLWYYHCRAHKGDRRTEKAQDNIPTCPIKMPTGGVSDGLNPDEGEKGKSESCIQPFSSLNGDTLASPPPRIIESKGVESIW